MKVFKEKISKKNLPSFQQNFLTGDMLLFDIETTGLSVSRNQIYCIGCGYADSENIMIELLFCEHPDEERSVLERFFCLLDSHDTIITFNGTTFDIPFIKKRAELISVLHDSSGIFGKKKSIDLFREAKRMKALLELPSYKQKSLEQFLGCYREDPYTGGELIEIYHRYIRQPDPKMLDLLLLHNFEDVRGMLDLLGILSYRQFVRGHFQITDILTEADLNREYINVKLNLPFPVPQSIHRITDCFSVLIDRDMALLRFPVYHGTLKHFFPDPENYYYLPEEDTAIHKSVGEYVDPSHRKKASKKNCYIKKECDYIVIPVKSENPLLQSEPAEKSSYLEIPVTDMKGLKELIQKLFQTFIK